MNVTAIMVLAPCALFAGAALELAAGRLLSPRVKGALAFLCCLISLGTVAALAPSVHAGGSVEAHLSAWDGPLALVLHVDGLSVLFGLMAGGIGALVLLYSIGYMAHDRAATRFYCLMLLFIGGFVGLVFSANLFLLYLCWEVVGLCSFLLVGFWYTNREAVNGARKVLLMTHIAGYGLLGAILVIYHRAGTALWTDAATSRAFTGGVFALMLVALVAKSVQFPLHTWIPEAMAAPTPVSSLLHSACYVTSGVYLAARMHSFADWPGSWGAAMTWVGTVTMAVGVMYAMVQTDLKRMLAFSTVSQIGYMIMGIGIGTPLAIAAGLLHCLNHGFFKGGLFLNAGSVQHATGTRDMNELGGLAGRMPQTTLWWLIGMGSMMGIPLMSGFASKWMLYAAALQAGWAVPALVAWAVSLGTVFLGAKATSAVFLGPLTDRTRGAEEAPSSMLWGMSALAIGSIALGIAPQLAVNILLNPILGALGMGTGIQVTWFGLSASAGSFSSMGGLVLALVSLVLGGGIYLIAWFARPVVATPAVAGAGGAADASVQVSWGTGGIFTGGEPLGDRGRLTARDFSDIFLEHWQSFFRWSNVDRAYMWIWQGLLGASRTIDKAAHWMEQHATTLVVVLAPVIAISVRFLAPALQSTAPAAAIPIPHLLIDACAIAAAGLAIAAVAQSKWRELAPLVLLSAAAALAGLETTDQWLRFAFLETGALLTLVLVWRCARSNSGRIAYAAAVAVSAIALGISDALLEHGEMNWSRALFFTSICVKLAAVPLFFWLLRLADEVPSLVLGVIISVIDMAAFGELWTTAQARPGLLSPAGLWLGVAAATSLIAALLMISPTAAGSLKRLLVLSTIEDVGFLLFGVGSMTALGSEGAMIAATTHALAKALLFASLSAPEASGDLGTGTALITRYPVSAFAFLFGMLAMIGVPPTLGFLGRWRIYETALSIGPSWLLAFTISSALALIAYAMALARIWWGPPESELISDAGNAPAPMPEPRAAEPFALRAALVGLVALLLVAGLWPAVLHAVQWGKP
ncbi:MAG TPA: proton-conducting transporter membrane subunit [Terracidiphilus sp.]|nr:proton-conducting transporter membrane subunit [Terracidiphilus sp.]